jgi:hypothetical protein
MDDCSMVNYRALIGRHEDNMKYMGIWVIKYTFMAEPRT